jgi:hypothetical protein
MGIVAERVDMEEGRNKINENWNWTHVISNLVWITIWSFVQSNPMQYLKKLLWLAIQIMGLCAKYLDHVCKTEKLWCDRRAIARP